METTVSEKPEDLNLPAAVVTRIIKEALPEGCNVSKDAKQALIKAATVFILYITAQASQSAHDKNKKTITNDDVFKALEIAEFSQFEDTLKEALEEFRSLQQDIKDRNVNKAGSEAQNDSMVTDEEMEQTS